MRSYSQIFPVITQEQPREQSPLVRPVRPFFDRDVDVGLLVKPIIMRLPCLARLREADVEEPEDLRDQFIDLA